MEKRTAAAVFAAIILASGAYSSKSPAVIRAHAAKEISAAAYGADGTDTKSDQTAIQNALSAANGRAGDPDIVTIPSGTYYLTEPLRIKPHTILKLRPDTVMKRKNQLQYMLSYTGLDDYSSGYGKFTDATIDGGIWDGSASDTTKAKGVFIFRNATNITLKNAEFRNVCGTHYLLMSAISGLTVENCTFSDFKLYTGSSAAYKEQVKAGLKYENVEALHTDYINGTPCKNVTIRNCVFDSVPVGIGTHHIQSAVLHTDNYVVENNRFNNCYYYGINTASFRDMNIGRNVADNCGGLINAGNSRGKIINNYFKGRTEYSSKIYSSASTSFYGIRGYSSSDIDVFYNDIRSARMGGIYFTGSSARFKGNKISGSTRGIVTSSGNYYNLKDDGKANTASLSSAPKQQKSQTAVKDSRKQLSASDFSIAQVYTFKNRQIRPLVSSPLKKNTDYTVSYSENKNVGKGTVKVTGIGSYKGTVTMDFSIVPAAPTVTTAVTSTGVKAYWQKDASAVKYYYQCFSRSDFNGASTKTSPASVTVRSFRISPGRTYYFRVKTIAVVDGVTYESRWSKTAKLRK